MSYKGVIFDLDGTLVDTLEDLAGAMNYGLAELGEPTHSLDECRRMIGNGVSKFAERALRADKQHLHAELLSTMKARYLEKCTDRSFVYDGLGETIMELRKAGVRLAVVTNKNANAAKMVVEHFFGAGTFEQIIGVEGDKWVKPDPAGTHEIIRRMGMTKKDFMLVGDSDVDIATAINAGIKPVGVTWGFRSRDELIAAGAETIVDSPGDILSFI
ncbi:MAG: HAD-IA family hydrolase [Phycisphaerae bacterium]|nr:HAD-IA family hydrolase [Phycisphaerae bacterium]